MAFPSREDGGLNSLIESIQSSRTSNRIHSLNPNETLVLIEMYVQFDRLSKCTCTECKFSLYNIQIHVCNTKHQSSNCNTVLTLLSTGVHTLLNGSSILKPGTPPVKLQFSYAFDGYVVILEEPDLMMSLVLQFCGLVVFGQVYTARHTGLLLAVLESPRHIIA